MSRDVVKIKAESVVIPAQVAVTLTLPLDVAKHFQEYIGFLGQATDQEMWRSDVVGMQVYDALTSAIDEAEEKLK